MASSKEYNKEYYKRNKEKKNKAYKEWYKSNKERKKKYNRKWREKNIEKRKEYEKRYKKNNRNKINNTYSKWRKKNREKVRFFRRQWRYKKRANGGSHTLGEWETLKAQYNWTCPCCNKEEPEIKLTEDHIIPVSKGGSNNIENIQPLCARCNNVKQTKVIKFQQGQMG